MIRLFSETSKTFNSNGDVIIQPFRAKVHKEDNADYYLELEMGLKYADYLNRGVIIVAPTPQGYQAFRVDNPKKTASKISIKAWHVSYDMENYVVPHLLLIDKNGDEAVKALNQAVIPTSPFTLWSDVATIISYECERETMFDALDAIREQWGGHFVRDNFDFGLKAHIGQDLGIIIEYKKNLKEISYEEDDSDLCTMLMPVGKDNVMLNSLDPSASAWLESDVQYGIPYAKTVTFEQNINKEDYPTETDYIQALITDLRSQGNAYLNENKVPKINYSIKAHIDKVTDIGDVIEVKDYRLGIDLMTTVISYDYDCLTHRYTEVEFGNFKPSIVGILPMLEKGVLGIVKDVDNKVDREIGKGLSENDFTDADVTKLDGIEVGANKAVFTTAENNKGIVRIGDLLIQWGKQTVTTTANVVLDAEYDFIPDVQVTDVNGSTAGVAVSSATATGFTINASGTNRQISWLAVGKIKTVED